MKILVGIDGSQASQKALEEAAKIAGGCRVGEVAVILVSDPRSDIAFPYYENVSAEQIKHYQEMLEQHKNESHKTLSTAKKFLEDQNINARTIFKEGHPSHTIVKVAEEEGFDMIVLGNRGLGGLKKILLGSVSNAVVQEVKNCNVLIVKQIHKDD